MWAPLRLLSQIDQDESGRGLQSRNVRPVSLVFVLAGTSPSRSAHAEQERRGGGWTRVAWEHADGEQRYAAANADVQPEELFDRHWALAMMERTLTVLQEEFAERGKREHFAELKAVLILEKGAIDYAVLAERLQMTEGAARVAVHRLRKRFRTCFRDEVDRTLEEGEDLEEELLYLARVLTG